MKRLLSLLLITAAPVSADVPRVATDIAPIHSITARIMAGVGEPSLTVPPNASPHHYAMRPSEARALSQADLVIWVGRGLTPWFADPLDTLAGQAHHLALLETGGAELLPLREGVAFGPDDHDHGHEHEGAHAPEDDHAGEDEGEHAHEDEHGQDDGDGTHDHEAHRENDHDHQAEHNAEVHDAHDHEEHHEAASGIDPHAWLDPRVGAAWAQAIATQLSAMDPEHAETYQANAMEFSVETEAFEAKWQPIIAPLREAPFLVFHDAFQYFEHRFDLNAMAAVQSSEAATPGAARIGALKDLLDGATVACAFSEPQFDPKLITTVTQGQSLRHAVLDPLGSGVPLGPDHYLGTLEALGQAMKDCLSQ